MDTPVKNHKVYNVALDEFNRRNKNSEKVRERFSRIIPEPYYHKHPFYVKSGKGCIIIDVDGNERIDYLNAWSVLILGHAHPKVVKLVRNEIENGATYRLPDIYEIELAEEISRRMSAAEMVEYATTGTEAVQIALRLARIHTRRKKIVMFDTSYHGVSDSVYFPGTFDWEKIGTEDPSGRLEEGRKYAILIPYNDLEIVEKVVKENKNEIAAIIVEPFLHIGAVPPKENFHKGIREITAKNDILMIFDEVLTGPRFRGGAHGLYNIKPDIVTLGKAVGGGYANFGAVAGSSEIMELFRKGKVLSMGTFRAHRMAMVAGLTTLKELTSPAYDHLNSTGRAIREGIQKAATEADIKVQVTGIGSFFNVFFIDQKVDNLKAERKADMGLRRLFDLLLWNRGVFIFPSHHSNVSLPVRDEHVKLTLKAVEQSLADMKPLIEELRPDLIL